MLVKRILNFILGYLRISVQGYFIERFINICISKKINLSRIERKKSSFLYANIGIADFIKMRKVAKDTKCRVKIVSKKGIPFIFKKYKKRKVFAIFLGLVLLLILVSSNFIWNIEIKCEDDINRQELLEQLAESGMKIGKRKGTINTKQVINDIRLKRADIAWIGIHIKGTNGIVEIVKSTKKPEIVKEDEYCNIVSDKEGVIEKINVQNGTALVKVRWYYKRTEQCW